jgi:hypothetical protein
MGHTILSFRQAVWMEYREWKPFRQALYDKSDRRLFDEMWELTALYNSAMSYAANAVRIYSILISMLLHNYRQLISLKDTVTELESKIKNKIIVQSRFILFCDKLIVAGTRFRHTKPESRCFLGSPCQGSHSLSTFAAASRAFAISELLQQSSIYQILYSL